MVCPAGLFTLELYASIGVRGRPAAERVLSFVRRRRAKMRRLLPLCNATSPLETLGRLCPVRVGRTGKKPVASSGGTRTAVAINNNVRREPVFNGKDWFLFGGHAPGRYRYRSVGILCPTTIVPRPSRAGPGPELLFRATRIYIEKSYNALSFRFRHEHYIGRSVHSGAPYCIFRDLTWSLPPTSRDADGTRNDNKTCTRCRNSAKDPHG